MSAARPNPNANRNAARIGPAVWARFAFVAIVSGISTVLLGVLLFQPGGGRRTLHVVLETSEQLDWPNDGPAGPLFTDGDLQSAVRWSTGVVANSDDIRRLRGALQVRVEPQRAGESQRRIRISLSSQNAATGRAALEHLSQIALMRLHLGVWLQEQEAKNEAFQAELDSARRGELQSMGELYGVVTHWLETQAEHTPVSLSPQRTPLNPRWEELFEKRGRLSQRIETLLETHRRTHPLVSRLLIELDRVGEQIERTPRSVALASAMPHGSAQAIGSTQTVGSRMGSNSTGPEPPEVVELYQEFNRAWEHVLSARRSVERSITPQTDTQRPFQRVAWIEHPVTKGRPTRLENRRMNLVLLAGMVAGLMIAAGEHHWRGQGRPEDAPASPWERPWHIALTLMAIATALLAMSAIHAGMQGDASFWLGQI